MPVFEAIFDVFFRCNFCRNLFKYNGLNSGHKQSHKKYVSNSCMKQNMKLPKLP